MPKETATRRTYDAVLFDKDGTLFEFTATWAGWAHALLMRVARGDRDRAARIGPRIGYDLGTRSFRPDSLVIAGTPPELADALGPHLPEMVHGEIVTLLNEEAERVTQVEAVSLAPFLDRLRAVGLRLGVATNDAEAPARAHIAAAGVLDRFDFIAGFDSGHGAKPEPGQLLAFCAVVGVEPARAVMVGDSTHDLIAGRAAGMATVGVLTGMAGRDELTPLADAVFPDIGHLTGWLRG